MCCTTVLPSCGIITIFARMRKFTKKNRIMGNFISTIGSSLASTTSPSDSMTGVGEWSQTGSGPQWALIKDDKDSEPLTDNGH